MTNSSFAPDDTYSAVSVFLSNQERETQVPNRKTGSHRIHPSEQEYTSKMPKRDIIPNILGKRSSARTV
jgi:hypothetical protein